MKLLLILMTLTMSLFSNDETKKSTWDWPDEYWEWSTEDSILSAHKNTGISWKEEEKSAWVLLGFFRAKKGSGGAEEEVARHVKMYFKKPPRDSSSFLGFSYDNRPFKVEFFTNTTKEITLTEAKYSICEDGSKSWSFISQKPNKLMGETYNYIEIGASDSPKREEKSHIGYYFQKSPKKII